MATILDILNEDCWRLVLDFVNNRDIIRSERVCRAWQQVVLQYLRGGPGFAINYVMHKYRGTHLRELTMRGDDPERFKMFAEKWGPYIRRAECINDASLAVIRKNCPNLEDITLHRLQNLTSGSPKKFKKLKRVQFYVCQFPKLNSLDYCCCKQLKTRITDRCVKHWIVNYNIEELDIQWAEVLTGRCFATTHSTKLKTLCLNCCEALDYRHFLAAADHFKQLRKLELGFLLPKEIVDNVHTLLDKLQDLEDLTLGLKFDGSLESAESVGRLRLRRLNLSLNDHITDEWLEKACCGFSRLEELEMMGCFGMSMRGVAAACGAARATLRKLGLRYNNNVENQHVEQFVRMCPNLTWLDLSYCKLITNDVTAKIFKARSSCSLKPVTLKLEGIRSMPRCPQPDPAYAQACSAQTLCSGHRGFLRALLPELAAIPTQDWLDTLEPLNDAQRLLACREHNELIEALNEVVSRVAPVYRCKDARASRERRRAAELELEGDEDAVERALAFASEAVLKAPTDDDEEATLALALWTRSAVLLARQRGKGTGARAALADLKLALRSRLPAKMRAHYYWRTGHCYRDCGEATRAKVSYELALRLLRADDSESRGRLQKDLDGLDFTQAVPEPAAKDSDVTLVGGCKPNMPALSKHIKIVEEEGKGRFTAACAPLRPGDVVLAENPYAACLLPDHLGTHCLHCFTRLSVCAEEAAVWCPRCAGVAFCSLSCRDKGMVYHQHECTFQDLFIGSGMSILSHIALRMVTQLGLSGTLDVFTRHVSGDAASLAHDDIEGGRKSKMKSRKERLNRSRKGLKMVEKEEEKEEKCEDEDVGELKTTQIYSLCTHAEQRTAEDYVKRLVVAAFLTECLAKSGFLNSVSSDELENARWSVTAVLIRNLQLLQFNAHEVFETLRSGNGKEGHLFRGARAQHIAVAIYPAGALFNHDCFPSVARYFMGRRLILAATRPLPPNAPVSECYGPAASLRPVAARQRALAARYWFTCACAACERPSLWPTMQESGDDPPPLKCLTPGCSGVLSGSRDVMKHGSRCSSCGTTFEATVLNKRIGVIDDCHKLFQEGARLMDEQQVDEAKSVICGALERFHEVAAAPRRAAYLAHEALRALLTSAGNHHIVKVKDGEESK